MTPTIIR